MDTYISPSSLIVRLESNEPKFLRKLKCQYGGVDSTRHEHPLSRPNKQKEEDDDDEPTYVDEDTRDIISKAQYNALLSGEKHLPVEGAGCSTENQDKPSEELEEPGEPREPKIRLPAKEQQIAAIGASGKRKVAKIIGNEEDDFQVKLVNKESSKGKKSTKKLKKIRLSFDEQAATD